MQKCANENVIKVLKDEIKVGDYVVGYEPVNTTYVTSGKENTAPFSREKEATQQSIEQMKNLKWKFIGTDKNENLEIMAEMPRYCIPEEERIILSGKGGYLYGPSTLNDACDKLYSVPGIGTARNINIDDVTNMLGYVGTTSAYYKRMYTRQKMLKTIAELEEKFDAHFKERITPDGKELGTYKTTEYSIFEYEPGIKNEAGKKLIFGNNKYWIASQSVYARFNEFVCFNIRYACETSISTKGMCFSDGKAERFEFALRPIVTLNPNISLRKHNDVWKIVQ